MITFIHTCGGAINLIIFGLLTVNNNGNAFHGVLERAVNILCIFETSIRVVDDLIIDLQKFG